MRVLLDTTVLIDYLRGRAAVERVNMLFARGDTPCTSPVNVEEIIGNYNDGLTSPPDSATVN